MAKSWLVLIVYVLNVSFNSGKKNEYSDKDKQNSIFFKMSRNSNRIAVFEQLQSSFRIKGSTQKPTVGQQVNTSYTTIEEVVELLGKPDVNTRTNVFVYTLNPNNGCKAIIEFDKTGVVVFVGIKDCG